MQGMKKSCVSIGLLFCHNSGANELFSPKVSQKICSSFFGFLLTAVLWIMFVMVLEQMFFATLWNHMFFPIGFDFWLVLHCFNF